MECDAQKIWNTFLNSKFKRLTYFRSEKLFENTKERMTFSRDTKYRPERKK